MKIRIQGIKDLGDEADGPNGILEFFHEKKGGE